VREGGERDGEEEIWRSGEREGRHGDGGKDERGKEEIGK
jgi:hypothetical protein